jgi:hypothetical protein
VHKAVNVLAYTLPKVDNIGFVVVSRKPIEYLFWDVEYAVCLINVFFNDVENQAEEKVY